MILSIPIGLWCYIAADDGVLSAGTLIGSVVIGAILMASAIAFLALQPKLH